MVNLAKRPRDLDDLDSEASRVLRSLVERLSSFGYPEFFCSFDPRRPRTADWASARDKAPDALGPLIDLFLLTRPVSRQTLEPLLGDLLEALCTLHLCSVVGNGELATPGLILAPIMNNWVFCQPAQPDQTIYFGDDSIALLWRMRIPDGADCLDLCAGPGTQSLQARHSAASVDAVEINPVAAALARINVLMNGAEHQIRVHCGDLYEPVQESTFDVVLANPPLLPFPDDIRYPLIGNGGPDGMRITWRILDGLPEVLRPKGSAQLIGCSLSDGVVPISLRRLESWSEHAKMDVIVTITAHRPLAPGSAYLDFLVNSAAACSDIGLPKDDVAPSYMRFLEASGATHLCAFFLFVKRGEGRVSIQNLSENASSELWYVSRTD